MTENEIKDMLKDIIDNGAEYEGRSLCGECKYKRENCDDTCTLTDRLWNKYHLGDEIRSDYEYRKVELWLVLDSELESNKYVCIPRSKYETKRTCPKPYFTGTEIKCKQWIEEHTNKIWLDETFPLGLIVDDLHMEGEKERLGATKVCKKILEEFENKLPFYIDTGRNHLLKDIKSIIKDLGVEV